MHLVGPGDVALDMGGIEPRPGVAGVEQERHPLTGEVHEIDVAGRAGRVVDRVDRHAGRLERGPDPFAGLIAPEQAMERHLDAKPRQVHRLAGAGRPDRLVPARREDAGGSRLRERLDLDHRVPRRRPEHDDPLAHPTAVQRRARTGQAYQRSSWTMSVSACRPPALFGRRSASGSAG